MPVCAVCAFRMGAGVKAALDIEASEHGHKATSLHASVPSVEIETCVVTGDSPLASSAAAAAAHQPKHPAIPARLARGPRRRTKLA